MVLDRIYHNRKISYPKIIRIFYEERKSKIKYNEQRKE